MSNNKKFNSQLTLNNDINFQDDNLPNEWEVHNNRINFIEQIVTKMQKKIQKIQNRIIKNQQSSTQYKYDFKLKFEQMISVVTQQQSNTQNHAMTQIIHELQKQIRQTKYNLTQNVNKFQSLNKQVAQLSQKTCFYFNVNQLQEYLNDRISSLQQKNKKYLNQHLTEINKNIQQLQKSIVDVSKNQSTYIQLSTNAVQSPNFNILNNSGFSKSSSQNALSNSRTQPKISTSPRSINFNEYNQPVRESKSSKRLTFTQEDRKEKSKQFSNENNLGSGKSGSGHSVNIQQGLIQQTSQNNSRVVYLRQKLKQFQQINKKYDKKQTQYQTKLKQLPSQHHRLRQNKNTSSHFQIQNNKSSQLNCQQEFNEKNFNKKIYESRRQAQNRISFSRNQDSCSHNKYNRLESSTDKPNRQSNSGRKYNNSNSASAKKFSFNNQNSAKKMDKLKSIKDYLQQSESQLQESFLQPNYKITKN